MQLALVLALDLEAGDGHCGRGEDGENGDSDNEFDKREAPLRGET